MGLSVGSDGPPMNGATVIAIFGDNNGNIIAANNGAAVSGTSMSTMSDKGSKSEQSTPTVPLTPKSDITSEGHSTVTGIAVLEGDLKAHASSDSSISNVVLGRPAPSAPAVVPAPPATDKIERWKIYAGVAVAIITAAGVVLAAFLGAKK